MRYTRPLLTIAVLLILAATASAQRKRPAPKPSPSPMPVAASEVKAGVEKVSVELKKVARFTYVLGGVAQGIEDIDAQTKAGKASRAAIDQNEKFKQSVVQGIGNLQSGLAALEVEFRTKPGLRPYVSLVDGITAMAGNAEDQAVEGKFKDAGRTLVAVIERLSDALAALP